MDDLTAAVDATADRFTLRLSRLCVGLSLVAAIGVQKHAVPVLVEWFDLCASSPRAVLAILHFEQVQLWWQVALGYTVLQVLLLKHLRPQRELLVNLALTALLLAAVSTMVLGLLALQIPCCVSPLGYQPLFP